ncbi:unnamed protein product [Rotaria magnacalcarata]|uniref:Globin-sensor domain-containing protein n=1 Tax=Rotaria magnacalcarata TaxID=392030 RepID=A0A819Z806_9BILA|nr:unnamed protein product [Rotaria magnacalcarata]CAF1593487.1 unnamed protein product [Rotaria magnacalcarata]CAF2121731.1 unnamed protein product [Rotaria magnacalcarata]CAF2146317.1 unnamed protein product [Rotaria magnacalcarata]CAF2266464.1 unnamed protein product [Rotaria magnacalcarata]
MAEHIDKNRLNTDLRYHYDYIAKFLNFTKDDIHTINTLVPILFPYIPHIVEIVHAKLCSFDVTKRCFPVSNDDDIKDSSSNSESIFTPICCETDFFKDILSIYLKRILIQNDWSDTFIKYLSEMGELYGSKNYFKAVNIEYIHLNALIGYIESVMIEMILKLENFDLKKKCAAVRALNKFFWIQNNLLTMHYKM